MSCIPRNGRRPTAVRRAASWLALAAVALTVAAPPAPARTSGDPPPTARYASRDDGRVLRFRWSDDRSLPSAAVRETRGLRDAAAALAVGGRVELVVDVAHDPDATPSPGSPHAAPQGFLFADSPASLPGVSAAPRAWRRLGTMTLRRDAAAVTVEYSVGHDRVALSLPSAALPPGGPPAGGGALPAALEINGLRATFPASALIRDGELVHGRDSAAAEDAAADLAAGLYDADRFVAAASEIQQLVGQATLQEQSSSADSCMAECLSCLGSILSLFGGTAGIGISCGGTVLSGGTAAPICLLSIVGTTALVLVTAVNCHRCDLCLTPDPQPGDDPSGGDEPDDDDDCEPCPPCGENSEDPACTGLPA
jgi:hypothetical protein